MLVLEQSVLEGLLGSDALGWVAAEHLTQESGHVNAGLLLTGGQKETCQGVFEGPSVMRTPET